MPPTTTTLSSAARSNLRSGATLSTASGGASPLNLTSLPLWKRIAHYAMHSAHLLIEVAEMANVMTGAALGGAIGSAAISLGMSTLGASQIVEGVRNKSGEQVMEGVGATLIGMKSGLDAFTIGSSLMHTGHPLLASFTHGVHHWLAPLGVANGAAEVVLGAKRVYDGIHEKDKGQIFAGALTIGLGASVCAASLGGGIPAMVCAGGFLAGRIVWEERAAVQSVVKTGSSLSLPSARKWTYYVT